MEIGIHKIPNEEYHADLSAVSHSALSRFEIAPRVYEWEYLQGIKKPETQAKRFGKLFHEALLEPEIFATKYYTDSIAYALCPNRTRKAYKDKMKEIDSENDGKELIKCDDWEDIGGMIDSVKTALVKGALKLGLPELTLCWQDKQTGLKLKCRPDFLRDDGVIIDVKTTDCAEESAFMRSNEKYKYFRQAAYYLRGATEIKGIPYKRAVLIVVEKSPPWLHNTFEIPEAQIWEGERQIKKLLQQFKECKERNEWPGYKTENQVTMLGTSDWFIKKVSQELEEDEAHEQTYGN